MQLNEHYRNLEESYLFTRIGRLVAAYGQEHPEAEIIRLGIGDVTRPLVPVVIEALHRAVAEMGDAATFRGYGDEQGYGFLREAIAGYYQGKGVSLDPDEIFVSDGAKSDLGNILDLFGTDNVVAIPNPVYPVYLDTNIMAGRKVVFLEANEENDFLPMPGKMQADIIYLCSPNNPTGAVYTRSQLEQWVAYALDHGSVILFDAAYEAFITDPDLPSSIYQIPGAKSCAIEFCSLSKTAGFTGTRCGYTVVPAELIREGVSLRKWWLRRQTTKFNGVPYIVQRGAEAVFSPTGQEQIQESLKVYRENARILRTALEKQGVACWGGIHSPYIWLKCPDGMDSWQYFDALLHRCQLVGTPGCGFGSCGEGYFRLTAFNTIENTRRAVERLENFYK
mgnify:FL=1